MARKANPALAIIGVVGLGVFAWLNWTRIKKVTHQLFLDIGGQQPQWTSDPPATAQTPPVGTAGTLGPLGTLGAAAIPELQRVPISDLALGPICREFPSICGLGG